MGGHKSGLFYGTRTLEEISRKRLLEIGALNNDTMAERNDKAPTASTNNAREQLLDEATTDETRGIVRELYRKNAEIGDGGTADAIRMQLQSGELVGGRDHIRKGRERLRQIKKILERNPDHPDRALLERLKDDLEDALGGA